MVTEVRYPEGQLLLSFMSFLNSAIIERETVMDKSRVKKKNGIGTLFQSSGLRQNFAASLIRSEQKQSQTSFSHFSFLERFLAIFMRRIHDQQNTERKQISEYRTTERNWNVDF